MITCLMGDADVVVDATRCIGSGEPAGACD